MLVFWDAKLVLLATPKTGSTAIEAALRPHASVSIQRPTQLKHTSAHRYHRFIAPYLEAASKTQWQLTALMREPQSWLNSWYRYRARDNNPNPEKSTKGMSFDEFVQAWCQPKQPEFANVGSQARFLRPRQGQGLTRIFRYEDFGTFHKFIESELGKTINFSQMNVSPAGENTLSKSTQKLLRETAAADFDLYESLT